ncbi:holo-ACP synthase [Salipaludibacillus keqinensis]|uniref:Holo-[acyl-carrier-protein] synthase n=1 Tax=Salipaludibacillus keqinensis TaxID=2045207 RepID=A0A323T8B7_9BACI|nr:holo-ACP synthase [Salipaludibacillus keqinensis]PYZ92112.1 holo-ACP synthase [Salipaludibacillus keqinensis]
MIHGIGLDIVELKRIESVFIRRAEFARRILTATELSTFYSLTGKRKIEFLAGRFAAKEAFAKALGCGIGKELSFQDMEIRASATGKPWMHLLKKTGYSTLNHVSITHTRECAAAQVIIESKE